MRIKINVSMSDGRRPYQKGDVVEWPDDADAQRLIDAGHADSAEPEDDGDDAEPAKPKKGRKKADAAAEGS